ncbi:glycosyltransferase family 2 protein [Stutzerimonas stutzeri]|uniref:glycosyltransferase family 2 protein n=1 Tax=Stutzerimonas stutzeri TaxID=316 RepID=UPI002243DD66|nr:glycosyltransferase family 2 protein [Stutzerimonas stutzeri]MCW8159135.1 glycosyltransferase family 2 protein [Stutzerimonas stutzeri]
MLSGFFEVIILLLSGINVLPLSMGSVFMNAKPLVSIVMPLYNAMPYFESSVASVLAQSYECWELLIVDDCSTDGCGQQAVQYASGDSRIKYFRNAANLGVAASRNIALQNAVGYFIAFLDSDDRWEPDKLEKQVRFMISRSLSITYCSYARFSENGLFLGVVNPKPKIGYKHMLFMNHIGLLTAMYDRRKVPGVIFMAVGHEDYLFWMHALQKVGSAECVPSDGPMAHYLVRKHSLSGNKLKAAKWQWVNYRENLGLGFSRSFFYFLCYAFLSFIRKFG